jgi:RNA polymerase sigma factor (sigma-70 family)
LGRAAPLADTQEDKQGGEEPHAEVATEIFSSAGTPSAPTESDEFLVAQVCNGDNEALARLFRRYARVVRAVSYRVLRDTSEADDLVQDLFLLVHRDCKTFDSSKGPARFWILQMAYRRAISRRRYLTRATSTHGLSSTTLQATSPIRERLGALRTQLREESEPEAFGRYLKHSQRTSAGPCNYTLWRVIRLAKLPQCWVNPEEISNTTTTAGWIGCEESFLVVNYRMSEQYDKRSCQT